VSLLASPPLQPPHKPGAPKAGFIEVMTIHTGNGFGEVALLQPTAKRSASIKTKEECEFLTIDKKTYELALKDKATQERNRRETFVRNHIFFRRLVNEKQNSLITSLKEKIYPRHSVIVRQGDEILKEGQFERERELIRSKRLRLI
jgi:CRP-like cAMP-binding protein